MRDHHQTSDEVAANLLDQVQLDDALFIKDEPAEQNVTVSSAKAEPVAVVTEERAPAPLPMSRRLNVPQSPAPEKTPQPMRVGGFSALLDHLKAEALRNEQRSKDRQASLRFAA